MEFKGLFFFSIGINDNLDCAQSANVEESFLINWLESSSHYLILKLRVPRCLIFHMQTTWNSEFSHTIWLLQIFLILKIGEKLNNMDQLNIS